MVGRCPQGRYCNRLFVLGLTGLTRRPPENSTCKAFVKNSPHRSTSRRQCEAKSQEWNPIVEHMSVGHGTHILCLTYLADPGRSFASCGLVGRTNERPIGSTIGPAAAVFFCSPRVDLQPPRLSTTNTRYLFRHGSDRSDPSAAAAAAAAAL